MTEALVLINDRLADAAGARGAAGATFYCECGDCLAEELSLSLDQHEEIRVREDLIFAAGHDAPRRYRRPTRKAFEFSDWRGIVTANLSRLADRVAV